MSESERYMIRNDIAVLAAICCLLSPIKSMASDESSGFRANLEDRGVTFGLQYLGEVQTVATGGIETGTEYLHLVNTPVTFDLHRLAGLRGATIYFNSQWATGGSPSELAGDLQTISNSDAPNTWKVYEAWFQQTFFDERLSVLAGLYDLNSEFDVIERGGIFINSSFGIGPDLSQSGENGPSVFPTTSLAVRVQAQVDEHITVRAAVFDGVAGDPDDSYGTKVILDKDDGLLIAGEIEFNSDIVPGLRSALGVWGYTESTETGFGLVDQPDERKSHGVYAIAEGTIWSGTDSREIGLFGRFGWADGRINQVGAYVGFGIVADNLFTGLPEHSLGLGLAHARNSGEFADALESVGLDVDRAETAVELTATVQVNSSVTIQPDLQYIINPGTDPSLENVLTAGLRLDASI